MDDWLDIAGVASVLASTNLCVDFKFIVFPSLQRVSELHDDDERTLVERASTADQFRVMDASDNLVQT